jgi:VWFA-related protein
MQKPLIVRLLVVLVLAAGIFSMVSRPADLRAQASARERTLFVSAVDKDDVPLQTLQPSDVVVREDGVRREVLRVSRATEPIDIALLVDNSASTDRLVVPLRDGLQRFIKVMSEGGEPPVQIAIIGLAARPTILSDYTSDLKQLNDAIGRIFPEQMSGMTLLDALVEVSDGLRRRETPRAAIVPVLTDGVEFTNRYYRDVVNALVRSGAQVHEVTIGMFPVSNENPIWNRAFLLEEAPRATGGQRMSLLSVEGVPGALEKLAHELKLQYKVVYSRPESLIPPEKIQLDAARPGIKIRGAPARRDNAGA